MKKIAPGPWTVADLLSALKHQPSGRAVLIEGPEGRMDDIGSLRFAVVVEDLGTEMKTENPWFGRYEEDAAFHEDRPKVEAVLLLRATQ